MGLREIRSARSILMRSTLPPRRSFCTTTTQPCQPTLHNQVMVSLKGNAWRFKAFTFIYQILLHHNHHYQNTHWPSHHHASRPRVPTLLPMSQMIIHLTRTRTRTRLTAKRRYHPTTTTRTLDQHKNTLSRRYVGLTSTLEKLKTYASLHRMVIRA